MPGGRLTHQDRRQVEAGLARGLGYAEIARRLGRPTSTISREVRRNGGSERYRADRAQQFTGVRARRSGPAGPVGELLGEPPAGGYGRDPEAVREFTERFAALMVRAGLSRMAARVLACLFTADSGALTAAELVRRLRVSPASVSKAVAYLEGLELLVREHGPGGRRERYVIDDDVWFGAWSSSARTTVLWADAAREGVGIFRAASPAGARLDRMSLFLARLGEDMDGGPVTVTAGEDVLTLLAALTHAGAPLTAGRLAAALGWPADRVARTLGDAEAHPGLGDPVALKRLPSGAYTIAARAARLTEAQAKALRCPGETSRHPGETPRPPAEALRPSGARGEPLVSASPPFLDGNDAFPDVG